MRRVRPLALCFCLGLVLFVPAALAQTPDLRGDLSEFGALMVGYLREDAFYEAFVDKVLYQRNYLMADRIEALLKENSNRSHFFAVGAGHYWGESGIQNLLAEKGFEIRRVSN